MTVRGRRAFRVQAVRTRRRWFAGFRKEYAIRASSFASRLRLSLPAFVTPVSTAQTSSSSHRDIVRAREISSGMSSFAALRAAQHDIRPQRQVLGRLRAPGPPDQLGPLRLIQNQLRLAPPGRRGITTLAGPGTSGWSGCCRRRL